MVGPAGIPESAKRSIKYEHMWTTQMHFGRIKINRLREMWTTRFCPNLLLAIAFMFLKWLAFMPPQIVRHLDSVAQRL